MFRGFSFFLVFTFATAALAWAETMTFSDAAAMLAKSCATFTLDDRVFHQKFGYGHVIKIDGNKLTIAFDKAGEKKVVDSFVERG